MCMCAHDGMCERVEIYWAGRQCLVTRAGSAARFGAWWALCGAVLAPTRGRGVVTGEVQFLRVSRSRSGFFECNSRSIWALRAV